MAPKVVDKAQKRARILRAALRILAQQGVSQVKMDDIATAASVGKGTLYEYFPSKHDLISGVFGYLLEEFQAFVESRVQSAATPREQLQVYIGASFDYFVKNKDSLEAMFDIYAAGIPRKDGKPPTLDMSQQYRQSRRWLGSIIEQGVKQGDFRATDPEFAAGAILAMLDGFLYQAVMGLVSVYDRSVPEQVERFLLNGLAREAT